MYAVLAGCSEGFQQLIARGADVNATTLWGWSALMFASISGEAGMVKALLARGARPYGFGWPGGVSPLMLAAAGSLSIETSQGVFSRRSPPAARIEITRTLIDAGADLDE